MAKVTLKRAECIGCGACVAVDGDLWEMGEDNKTNLKGGTDNNGVFEKDIDDSAVEKAKDSAESCPINIITVE